MWRSAVVTCFAACVAYGQPAIAPPRVGVIRDSNHALRAVLGLAGNFVLDASVVEHVISSAFSGSFAIVKTDTAITVLDRAGAPVYSGDAEGGPALFAFTEEGAPAFVYLPESQTLLQWKTDRFESAILALDQSDGTVLAIASPAPGRVSLVLKRADGTCVLDLSGEGQFALPAMDGPVWLRNDGAVLYATTEGLILRHRDGAEQAVGGTALQPERLSFEQMSRDWVHVTAPDSAHHYAVRLTPGHEQTYELPEAQP